MKEIAKLAGVLFFICVVAGILLAAVRVITEGPIADAARRETMRAIETVLPEYTNDPDAETVAIESAGQTWTFYVARNQGRYVGTAFATTSPQGYGGEIMVMVGINTQETVQAIEILRQKETPGLGAKISEPAFKNAFAGRSLRDTRWAVRKDNGDIDQITAATISSRAVVDAVKRGIEVYLAHAATIQRGKPEK